MTGTNNKTRHLRNFCGSIREKSKNGPFRAVFTINCPTGMPVIGPSLLYEPLPLRPHQLVGTRMNNRHFGGFCAWMIRKSNYLGFFWGGGVCPFFCPQGMCTMGPSPLSCPIPPQPHQMTGTKIENRCVGKLSTSMREKCNYSLSWATKSTTFMQLFTTSSLLIFKHYEWKMIYIKFLIQWWKLLSSVFLPSDTRTFKRRLCHGYLWSLNNNSMMLSNPCWVVFSY